MANWLFLLVRELRRLWVSSALYSGLGILAALLSARFGGYIPSSFALSVGADSVESILGILASSMLAVATFSLTTLVTAYTAVSANVSPRAAELLVTDTTVRHSLGSFVGAFLYSVVGVIAVHTGYYGSQGRVILFFITIGVILLVVIAMLRWIGELSSLAQTRKVIARVAQAVQHALAAPTATVPDQLEPPRVAPRETATPVGAEQIGFVQNIDMSRLRKLAGREAGKVEVVVLPGSFVRRDQPLLWVSGRLSGRLGELRECVNIGPMRTFNQDVAFGLQVLGEIAARALSPGVNDPGTAREVAASIAVLLANRQRGAACADDERNAVVLPQLSWGRLLDEGLGPIVRHGAADPGLQIALHEALSALAHDASPALAQAAREFSLTAFGAALSAITEPDALERLACAATAVVGPDAVRSQRQKVKA